MDYPGQYEESEILNYKIQEKKILEDANNMDRGYNKILRNIKKSDGKIKRSKIDIYTSGGTGSNIRDAITGQYMSDIVGTTDEDKYYKVGISTGECKSKNGSNTLFFTSPNEYARHFYVELNENVYKMWEQKNQI